MPLELVQLLYTAWCALEGEDSNGTGWRKGAPLGPKPENYQAAAKRALPHVNGYRSTHIHHQCSKWVRLNKGNYLQTANAALALANEYTKRFKKILFVHPHILWLLDNIPPSLQSTAETPTLPPQIVPDQYKFPNPKSLSDVCEAYKRYYIGDKRIWCRYTRSERPTWLPMPSEEEKNEEKKNKLEAKNKKKTTTKSKDSESDNSESDMEQKKGKLSHKDEEGEKKEAKKAKKSLDEDESDVLVVENKKKGTKKAKKQSSETGESGEGNSKQSLSKKDVKTPKQKKKKEIKDSVRVHTRSTSTAAMSDDDDVPLSSRRRTTRSSGLASSLPGLDEDDTPLLPKKGTSAS